MIFNLLNAIFSTTGISWFNHRMKSTQTEKRPINSSEELLGEKTLFVRHCGRPARRIRNKKEELEIIFIIKKLASGNILGSSKTNGVC